uniref:C2H2-type domain-containing protein n=1 Tax=Fusarium oxysporum (strain Fo5176) TaxID=660025 RepID=A0A0D2XKJ4_FUSOF
MSHAALIRCHCCDFSSYQALSSYLPHSFNKLKGLMGSHNENWRECFASEPKAASGHADGSSDRDPASACTLKNGKLTNGKDSRLLTPGSNLKPDKLDYGLSSHTATSQGQVEHALHAQEAATRSKCKMHFRFYRNPRTLTITAYRNKPSITNTKELRDSHLASGQPSYRVTSDVMPSPKVETLGQEKVSSPDDIDLEVLGGAATNPRLLPENVKQHLTRRHTWSYSCSRCLRGFSLQKVYEEHVLQQECPIKDSLDNDSVSPRAQEALKYRVDRSSSPEHQWHDICRILFGELEDALNPHHDGVFKEITGIIRGIWREEEHNIISSLKDTQSVPSAGNLRPLLSEILTRVEDCFEQREQKTPKANLKEPIKTTQDTDKGGLKGGEKGYTCEPPSGASSSMLNTGPTQGVEPFGLPTQQWNFQNEFDTSSSVDYIFDCLKHPQYQSQQPEYSDTDLSSSLLYSDSAMKWNITGLNSEGEDDSYIIGETKNV